MSKYERKTIPCIVWHEIIMIDRNRSSIRMISFMMRQLIDQQHISQSKWKRQQNKINTNWTISNHFYCSLLVRAYYSVCLSFVSIMFRWLRTCRIRYTFGASFQVCLYLRNTSPSLSFFTRNMKSWRVICVNINSLVKFN